MRIRTVLLIAAAAALTSCAGVERSDVAYARSLDLGGGKSIIVVEDPVAGVTCWVTWTGSSCMPNRFIRQPRPR